MDALPDLDHADFARLEARLGEVAAEFDVSLEVLLGLAVRVKDFRYWKAQRDAARQGGGL